MKDVNKTLVKLFNAVLSCKNCNDYVIDHENGVVLDGYASWAKKIVSSYYKKERLNGNDLNKTFHKSWEKIVNSTRSKLALEQILHYLSTYGTGHEGPVYIPQEVLDVPVKLKFKVVRGISKHEAIDKCLNVLRSGIALKEETIDELLEVLSYLGYKFKGDEKISNKEAIIKIIDRYSVVPNDPNEVLRYAVYKATDSTLLIKSEEAIDAIKRSKFNPNKLFKQCGLHRMAEIFNRFKPLFLAFKRKCPKTINKISKLSKTEHCPMVENPLNVATSRLIKTKKYNSDNWLVNATPFALFRALSACHVRANGIESFMYQIRNGKSWVGLQSQDVDMDVCEKNVKTILDFLREKYKGISRKIYIPENIEYALPTSEKMFVGNIPTGTKFFGDNLIAGIYWEDAWGARDLDLSCVGFSEKIGWNSSYKTDNDSLLYSGDLTSAQNGAVEYFRATKEIYEPYLLLNNIYSGEVGCEYKIIIGNSHKKVSEKYMMDPNNLIAETRTKTIQKQMVVGMFLPNHYGSDNKGAFVTLNLGAGHSRVSGSSPITVWATKALFGKWSDPMTLKNVIDHIGFDRVDTAEEADFDLSPDNLEKDTFVKLFEKNV